MTIEYLAPHRCTICKKVFQEPVRGGRPTAFCSPACRAEGRRTKARFCRICQDPFSIGPANDNNPFYCSPDCRELTLCWQCYGPTPRGNRFCSVAHMMKAYPPPYTCKNPTCKNPLFFPSDYFLAKDAALKGPPKYCDSQCYITRDDPDAAPASPLTLTRYRLAAESVDPPYAPDSLPLTASGGPWFRVEPVIPQNQLHIKSQNTIRVWDWALNTFTDDLTPLEYNAFLFEFVMWRTSPHPYEVDLQACMTIWPYIAQYTDDRYSPTMVERFTNAYLYSRRHFSKKYSVMPPNKLDMLVRQCHDLSIRKNDPRIQTTKQEERFIEHWLRPLSIIEAPYPHPRNPRLRCSFSRIQLELRKLYTAYDEMGSLTLTYLSPLTQDQLDNLQKLYASIMEIITKTYAEPNLTKWPWGPNCYSAMEDAYSKDVMTDLKWEMFTTPRFNLPEPSRG
jgi:hypothetical protein